MGHPNQSTRLHYLAINQLLDLSAADRLTRRPNRSTKETKCNRRSILWHGKLCILRLGITVENLPFLHRSCSWIYTYKVSQRKGEVGRTTRLINIASSHTYNFFPQNTAKLILLDLVTNLPEHILFILFWHVLVHGPEDFKQLKHF
jgi:hypothetical protein